MKHTSFLFLCLALVLSSILWGCSKSVNYEPAPPDPYEELQVQLAQSPRPDEEAELMALWMSGDVVAYERDYDRVREALDLVRTTFRDTVSFLDSIEFLYRVQESVIGLALTDSATGQLRAGAYTDWDSLNTLFQLIEIDTSMLAVSQQVDLTFEGRLNPSLLSVYYAALPGVTGSFLYVRTGDYSNIYPWKSGNDFTFLLRSAWGDCLPQCDFNRFWYFRVGDGVADYIGEYLVDDPPIWPYWWEDAKVAFCRYISHRLCYIQ
jgi:hypothetical protein